jgi:hypothetical protein
MTGLVPQLAAQWVFRFGISRATVRFWVPASIVVLVAVVLRFVWVADIEYKIDERWTFERVAAARRGEPWPRLGMPTSQNAPNPGLSVWAFIVLGQATGAETPTELARACQCLNVLALFGLLAFAWLCVPRESRGMWLWAAALIAVNPITVLLHRKIWPPSICPILLLGVLVGFWHRDRRWGAALWGALVMLVAQMSLAGLFLAAGVAGWAACVDRARVRWRWWALGSLVGGWPLLPWGLAAYSDVIGNPTGQTKIGNVFTFKYWLRWVSEPFGMTLRYSLGNDFSDYLREPVVGGVPTYLMGVVNVGLAILGVYLLAGTVRRAWANRARFGKWLTGNDQNTRISLGGVMIGFGVAITVSTLPIHRHYMLLTFPFMHLWLAMIALADRRPAWWGWTRGQALLAAVVLLQSAATVGFLGYIHSNQRTIRGDYWTPYQAQVRFGPPPN